MGVTMKIAACLILAVTVSAFPSPLKLAEIEGQAPPVFTAELNMDSPAGKVLVEIHRDWAPKGADRFYQLIKSGFFNQARIFRVVPNFVVQFGINGDPAIQQQYRGAAANLLDDPVKPGLSNKKGTVTFATAGPNTRTTQLFINTGDNYNLDSMGFAPIGKVVQGMDQVGKIYSGYGEQPDQGQIQTAGNKYLQASFPKLTYFTSTKLVANVASKDVPWN